MTRALFFRRPTAHWLPLILCLLVAATNSSHTRADEFNAAAGKRAAAIEDTRRAVAEAAKNLAKLRDEHGEDHPAVEQHQAHLDALTGQLKALEEDAAAHRRQVQEEAKAEALRRSGMPAKDANPFDWPSSDDTAKVEALRKQALQRNLAAQAEAVREQQRSLPPIEEGEIKVFQLRHADVIKTAEMVQSLFGVGQMRIAVDDRTNSLVAFGQAEPLKVIEAILMNLDQKSADVEGKSAPKSRAAEPSPRSVMVRVFWLADSPNAGPPAIEYLPESVIAGVQKLGLSNAQLVAQSANTLSAESRNEAKFSTFVTAQMGEQQVELQGVGNARWLGEDRIGLELNLQVMGDAQSQVGGSLAMPLGHYMVLGASNSVIQGRATTVQKGSDQGVFVAEKQPAKAIDSRFAFVVQVVEAESYAAEKSE